MVDGFLVCNSSSACNKTIIDCGRSQAERNSGLGDPTEKCTSKDD
jgi:hypothetical protein